MPSVHPTKVRSRATASPSAAGARSNSNELRRSIDPAARSGKRVYNALSASSVGLELGLSVGNVITYTPLIVQHEFAPAAFPMIVGFSVALNQIAYALAPGILGAIRDLAGV